MTEPLVSHSFAYTVFCDDIRQEAGNKLSYMGVYSDEIFVATESPVLLPKLCAAVYAVIPNETPCKSLTAVLYQDIDGVTSELARSKSDVPKDVGRRPGQITKATFLFVVSPFSASDKTMVRARVYIDESAEVKAGAIRISVAPDLSIPISH